jgi:hypothetical protein
MFNDQGTDILNDDVSQVGTDPTTGGGFTDTSWLDTFKKFGDTVKTIFDPKGQFAGLPLLGAAALARNSSFFNPPPAKVGFQGTIPTYTANRQMLDIPTVTASGAVRRPGSSAVKYFSDMEYTPLGQQPRALTPQEKSAAQQAANKGIAALPYATGTRATDAQIAQLYKDVFNREVDPQGLAFYRASGFSPAQIKEQLLASPEYKGMLGARAQQYATGQDANAEAIRQIYKDVLGREADVGGLAFYDQSKFSPEQIRADIMKSPEYREQQIRKMYQDVLGREADTGGLKFYMDPKFSLEQVKSNLSQSPEAVLRGLYQDVLGRTPDREGMSFWLNAMQNMGYTPDMVREAFMQSPEYTGRRTTTDRSTRRTAQGVKSDQSTTTDDGWLPGMTADIVTWRNDKTGETRSDSSSARPPSADWRIDPNRSGMLPFAAGGQMPGGIAMLARGRYLKGNGDGVSDSIRARFDGSGQEARLADGEFVIPARVVSELGNGSSDAGARKLYAMLDRVEARAKKAKRGKPSGADRELNKLA